MSTKHFAILVLLLVFAMGSSAQKFEDLAKTPPMNRTNQPWKLDYDWKKQTMYFATEVSISKKHTMCSICGSTKILGKPATAS